MKNQTLKLISGLFVIVLTLLTCLRHLFQNLPSPFFQNVHNTLFCSIEVLIANAGGIFIFRIQSHGNFYKSLISKACSRLHEIKFSELRLDARFAFKKLFKTMKLQHSGRYTVVQLLYIYTSEIRHWGRRGGGLT